MEAFLNTEWAFLVVVILVAGSIVDLFQFGWIVRRTWAKFKRRIYHKVRREIISQYEDNNDK